MANDLTPPLRVTAVSGSLHAPSTTAALIDGILDELAQRRPISSHVVALHALAADLAAATTGGGVSAALGDAQAQVAAADLVVVATPIYRGAYTGLFKVFFDLLHQDALAGTPVLPAAGGGSDLHALAVDHTLRPLLAFFRAATLPVGVYARSADFTGGRIDPDGALPAAITRAVDAAAPVLQAIAAEPLTVPAAP